MDDRRIVSAIVFVIRNGLRWRDAPPEYGPHKTIYNQFIRWSRLGVFNKIFAELAGKGCKPERIMIDATHLKAHRTAASLKKGPVPRRIGRTKGGLNSKLQAVCDSRGRPLVMLLSEGQRSDYQGAALMLPVRHQSRAASQQGLRRRLVPRRPRQARHRRLHPLEIQSEGRHPP